MRLLAAIACSALVAPWALHADPASLPAELREWIAAQPALPSFTVDFEMTRKLPALRDPIDSRGTLARHRDGRFEWKVGEPPVSIVTFDGATLRAWEDGGEWRELDEESRKARSWLMFLGSQNDTLRELDRRFTARVIESTSDSVTVALDPRAAITRKYLREIRLRFDPTTAHLRELRILQGDAAETRLAFAKPRALEQ